ncbi:hypothetical protein KFL_016240010, partial [Klebsormidium nitens]
DETEVRHVRHILKHADNKKLVILDARLGKRNEQAPTIVQGLGRHAWEQMHLEGAARKAEVWETSTETLTKLSTNNWGKAFRTEAQEEAWREAWWTEDYSYFEFLPASSSTITKVSDVSAPEASERC